MLRDQKLFAQLKNKKFDAVLAETFDISGMYLGNRLDIPLIATMSFVRFAEINRFFGGGSLLGYVPEDGSKLGNEAGFLDRLNDVYTIIFEKIFIYSMMSKQQKMCQEALGENVNIPHWKDLFSKPTVYLTNSNPYLDFAIPNGGNIIPIGGFTMDSKKSNNGKATKLPEEFEKIMSERKHTVLISFGTVIRSYQMPENLKQGLVEAMRKLPDITFIWKYEKLDDLEFTNSLPSNIHLKTWVPQPAILADSRLSLFITHGGLASTMEIAYSGIVSIMIPIFGDQPFNAMMLARHGGAVVYDRFDFPNSQKLVETIQKITTDPMYKTKAVELSNVLNNQPIDPKQILLKNVEFAVQFPNFKSRIPEINSAGIIGYYYIDVFLFITFLIFAIFYITIRIIIFLLNNIKNFLFLNRKTKAE